jgi:di/tricarboxylate transporter
MSTVLEMPTRYTDLAPDELDELEGGIGAAAVIGIIGGAMGIGAGFYRAGQIAGERAYRAGLRNGTYQKIKWQVRGAVVGMSPVGGAIVMTGFENKFYSLI